MNMPTMSKLLHNVASWLNNDNAVLGKEPQCYPRNASTIEDTPGMNFTVFNATGGKVVQIRSYDKRTDRTNSTLYIITDKEDLGEEISQIITRESLTR